MAQSFPSAPAVVHEGDGAILMLDREPIRWGADGRSGLAWEEQPGSGRPSARNHRDAAVGSCGLAFSARLTSLHSSVSGAAPLYLLAEDGALYFATSVDALAISCPRPLSADWDAWAAILTLGYPLGDRTPFEEIQRLGPSSVAGIGASGAEVNEERWPWAEVEPETDVEDGAGAVLEGMRAAVDRLVDGPLVCPLSGGLDSRLCLGLLADAQRVDVRTFTAVGDSGDDAEHRAAARVAQALGFPHEAVVGDPEDYWRELERLAGRVDYQVVRAPWRMPMLQAFEQARATAVDGFGFDTFAAPGDRFFTPGTIDPSGGDDVVAALWSSMSASRRRPASTGLDATLANRLWESAERQLRAESERFAGHPARALLTLYRARQLRGVSLAPVCALGKSSAVSMPLMDDDAVRAALAITMRSKRGGHLYDALFASLAPELVSVPSTRRATITGATTMPRRSQSASVAEAYRKCLAAGPLAGHLRRGMIRALGRPRRGGAPRVPAALLGPVYFHLWYERYRARLAPIDPGDVLAA